MTRLEPHATHDDARAVAKEVRALARWLALPNVSYERVPPFCRSALA